MGGACTRISPRVQPFLIVELGWRNYVRTFFTVIHFSTNRTLRRHVLGQVFEREVQESPVSVMVRGLLEKVLCSQTRL